MAATGYTPIQLYYSTTAAAVPTAGNLASGELAINITDGKLYYKNNSGTVTLLAGSGGGGPAAGSNTQIQFNNSGVFGASANLTWDGTYLTAGSIKDSALTSGRVTFAGASGLLTDSANLTFNGTTLTANTIGAFTLGGTIAGGGNQINNVIIGTTTPLAGAFTTLTATTSATIGGNTETNPSLTLNSAGASGNGSAIIGRNVGNADYAVGNYSSIISGTDRSLLLRSYNDDVQLSAASGKSIKSSIAGGLITEVSSTGFAVTGTFSSTLDATISGVTAGKGAGSEATNTVFGRNALVSNSTGVRVTAVGNQAGYASTGSYGTFVGQNAGIWVTGSYNTAIGNETLAGTSGSTTGTSNTAVGYQASYSNTTASSNVAVGYQAGYSNQTGGASVYIGYQAGYTNTASGLNVFVGYAAGNIATGNFNTFIGPASGESMTSGTKNTILGRYSGNQGGLDIRTSNNYIVLSDGDGNPRAYWNGASMVQNADMTVQGATTIAGRVSAFYDGASNDPYGVYSATTPTNANNYASFAATRQGQIVWGWGINTSNEMCFGQVSGPSTFSNQLLKINGTYGAFVPGCFGVGNQSPSTSGGGITFPATQSASSNANTLDDYEEGSWTPVLNFSGGITGIVASYATGSYVKIGKVVHAWCSIYLSNKGSSTGDASVAGLPFVGSNGFYNEQTGSIADVNSITFGGIVMVRVGYSVIAGNISAIQLFQVTSGNAQTQITNTAFINSSSFSCYVCYTTS